MRELKFRIWDNVDYMSEVAELKNAITEVDARIDSMINRLPIKN